MEAGGKKSQLKLANQKQSENLFNYVDSLKVLDQNVATRIDTFDIMQNNEDLYVEMNKNLGKKMPNVIHSRDDFYNSLDSHCVDLDEINS